MDGRTAERSPERNSERASRYPFSSYPDGWYHLAASSELAVGEVRALRAFGRDLVLCRSESGRAAVFDAHCPHLGAHLGHGGKMVGETLRCPFHGWRFDGSGACVEVPYRTRGALPTASLRSWRVDERAGLILVWHSETGREPGWHMRDIPEYDADDWIGYETRRWTIRMHVQELAENVPDRAHFEVVHGVPVIPDCEPKVDGPVYYQRTAMPGLGPEGGDLVIAEQECWGLGLIWLRSPGPFHFFYVTATTPIDDEFCEVTQHMLIHDPERRGALPPDQHALMDAIFDQTDADVPIWENKIYRGTPPLTADDGPLPVLRRWARQFYPAESGETSPA